MKFYLCFLYLSLGALIFSSCGDDNSDLSNEEQILEYLNNNGLTAQKTNSGLYYIINEPGVDPFPNSTNTVTVDYHGYLLNGNVFDSSVDRGTPLTISLTQVIQGWKEGIPLYGTGGKGTLFIPSNLAYGRTGSGPIPPNTPIVFDLELISVN